MIVVSLHSLVLPVLGHHLFLFRISHFLRRSGFAAQARVRCEFLFIGFHTFVRKYRNTKGYYSAILLCSL